MAITELGYNEIIQRIVDHIIEIPEGMTAAELMNWLKGYGQAQNDIIRIIMDLKKGQKE